VLAQRPSSSAVAAVLAQPPLVDAIRARIGDGLDALSFAAALAPREDFELDYTRALPLTDDGAARLADAMADCGQVVSLWLEFSSVLTAIGVGHVARLRSLRSLDLDGTAKFDDDCARILSERLTALTALGLAGTGVSDAGVACICDHLRALRCLDFQGCARVTAAGVSHLSSLVLLTSLRSPLSLLHVLPSLALAGGSLRSLFVARCTAADWRSLPAVAPALTSLSIDFDFSNPTDPLSRDDVARLASGLPSLASLWLCRARFEGGAHGAWLGLSAATRLTELDIRICCFGDDDRGDGGAGLLEALLPALPRIRCLTVMCSPFGDGDLAAIGRHLPHCIESLDFRYFLDHTVTCAGLADLAACTALTRLDFTDVVVSSDAAAAGAALAAIAAAAPLQELGGLAGGVELAAFRRLTTLSLGSPSRAALAALPAPRGSPLVHLSLSAVALTDGELTHVAALSQLTALEIVGRSWAPSSSDDDDPDDTMTPISDAGLRALASGLVGLRELKLDLREVSVAITDAGLEALCALPRLRRLRLRLGAAPAVTPAGVARVKQLPALLRFQMGDHLDERVALWPYK
jgi:hypothetical protein